MTMLDEQTQKYDIPLSHLDYSYIEKCTDGKELEKILKCLRSGIEGNYPELEKRCEDRLRLVDSKSRLLRKTEPLQSLKDIPKDDALKLQDDLSEWLNDMKVNDAKAKHVPVTEDKSVPIRDSVTIQKDKVIKTKEENPKKQKQVKPRDYKEWDKFDVDKELEKCEKEEKPTMQPGDTKEINDLPPVIDITGMDQEEKERVAEREKNKGNEAFYAKDYVEAILYYNRSISVIESGPCYNNRAMAYVKLEKWAEAVSDCNSVLKLEPNNIKAYLRRAAAHKGKKDWKKAEKDLNHVLKLEPHNQRAKKLMEEVTTSRADEKAKGKRMKIVEVDGDEKEDNLHKKEEPSSVPESPSLSEVAESELVSQESAPTEVSTEKVSTPPEEQTKELQRPVFKVSELPKHIEKLKAEGNDFFKKGQYHEAEGKYDKAITALEKADGDHRVQLSRLYSNRAGSRYKSGKSRECIKDSTRAVDLVPHFMKPLLRRAQAYETLEKYRDAYVDYKHVTALDFNVESAVTGASRCSKHLIDIDGPKWREKLPPMRQPMQHEIPIIDDPSQSVEITTPTTPQTPNLAPAQVPSQEPPKKSKEEEFSELKAEGNKLVQKGDHERAILLYTNCTELFDDRAAIYTNRALCYLKCNKPELACIDCDKALELEPENVKALFRRAQGKKALVLNKSSLADLAEVLKIDPKNAAAKKEFDIVKDLYRQELNAEKSKQKEKKQERKKVTIEEIDGSSDEEEKKTTDTTAPSKQSSAQQQQTASQQQARPTPHKKIKKKGKGSVTTTSGNGLPSAAPSVQKLEKITPYEFMNAWNSLKSTTNMELYSDLLEQVPPSQIPKVLSNKLDGDMLTKILKCLQHYLVRKDPQKTYEYLVNVTKVQRFNTVTLFMSADDKKLLNETLSSIPSTCDTSFVKKQFGLKI